MNDHAIPASLLAAITGRAKLPTDDGIVELQWQDIGVLPIPSGRLIACDAVVFSTPEPFEQTIEPDAYPLRLLIAHYENGDQRIAAAILVFDDSQMPVRWKLATTEDQEVGDLGPDEIYGYSVDSGVAGFLDMHAAEALEAAMEDAPDYYQQILDDMEETYEDTRSWAIHAIQEDPDLCIAAFSSGCGDGVYPSYWGLDSRGRIVWLITDFDLL